MKNLSFYCLFLLILVPMWASALESYTPKIEDPILEPWRWRCEETLDGLNVFCMDEAEDGSLWFGCAGNIVNYDGHKLKQISFDVDLFSDARLQRSTPRAKALMVLQSGDLLVVIERALVLREGGKWRVLIEDVGRSESESKLQQLDDGSIWLLTPTGLWRVSRDFLEISKVLEASQKGFLGSFDVDASGNLWVCEKRDARDAWLIVVPAAEKSLSHSSTWRRIQVPFETDAESSELLVDRSGLVWYGDESRHTSIATYDSKRKDWIRRAKDVPNMRLFSLLEGTDGTIWGGGRQRILRTSGSGKATFYNNDQLPLPRVQFSMFETSRRLWMIGGIGHVYSVDIGNSEWITYKHLNFQCESSGGKRWFLSKKPEGAVVHDPSSGKWTQLQAKDGLINSISRIVYSSHSLVWAAGSHEGQAAIAVFDGKGWTRFIHPELGDRIGSKAVLEAGDETMWFGASSSKDLASANQGGFIQYKVDEAGCPRLLAYHSPPSFPRSVGAMACSKSGTIQIGSAAFYRYNQGDAEASLTMWPLGKRTTAALVDRNQNTWFARQHTGLYQELSDGSWKLHSQKDGLVVGVLSDLLLLNDGTILAASGKGISRFDGRTWTPHVYPEELGFSSRWSGMRESADGAVWFNTSAKEGKSARSIVNKTIQFRSVRHMAEKQPPHTQITDYLEHVAQPGNTHIKWSGHDPWGSTPRNALQYSWRMDEGPWSAFTGETGNTFLDLSSGDHVLEVRARDLAFNVDPIPDRITFSVAPPAWRQAWFIILMTILLGTIVFLLWLMFRARERYLFNKQLVREAYLQEQQKEREALLYEQQKEREEHLQEMDRLKTGFFTNISHELRTPLTVVSGRLESIIAEETDEEKRGKLSTALRNARRMSNLVTQLLDFRKIEEGKIAIHTDQGDLAAALEEWIASLRVTGEHAKVACHITALDPCAGRFDFDKIQKIFTNLISNSIKYTAAGGEVKVSMLVEEGEEGQPQLRFMVEDNGIGIPAEHLDQIFERFYRVDESSMASGAGIGLNLAKELVDLLGGSIEVKSPIHPDQERPGTRFTVVLPIVKSYAEPCDPADPSVPEAGMEPKEQREEFGEKPLVLVVEDDDDIRSFIMEGLAASYEVISAVNGKIGLEVAKERVPDLIVTDLMMPELDGTELCTMLKAGIETSHIPIIMLTAKASIEHQLEGLKTGADDYVTKPFHMGLLQARIENLLESRRLLREKFSHEYFAVERTIPKDSPERKFLEEMAEVLEDNYTDWDFNVKDFAAALGIHLRTLQRKIKAVTDLSPQDVLNEFRARKAAELLVSSNDSITEIAAKVGIIDPSNFPRLFKRFFGMSPSEYRSKH